MVESHTAVEERNVSNSCGPFKAPGRYSTKMSSLRRVMKKEKKETTLPLYGPALSLGAIKPFLPVVFMIKRVPLSTTVGSEIFSLESMERFNNYRIIAYQPYCPAELALLLAATRLVCERFGNFSDNSWFEKSTRFPTRQEATLRTIAESEQEPILTVEDRWIRYAERISKPSFSLEGSCITPSLRDLVCDCPLDSALVEEYLQLLRDVDDTGPSARIAEVRRLEQDTNFIGDGNGEGEGVDYLTIIPFIDGQHWAFVVAYADCLHWYDSEPGGETPRFSAGARRVVEGWRGPRHSKQDDAGVFMLMGITRILQRKPHLSQEVIDKITHTFRVRMLIQLLTKRLEPTSEDLEKTGVTDEMTRAGAWEQGGAQNEEQAEECINVYQLGDRFSPPEGSSFFANEVFMTDTYQPMEENETAYARYGYNSTQAALPHTSLVDEFSGIQAAGTEGRYAGVATHRETPQSEHASSTITPSPVNAPNTSRRRAVTQQDGIVRPRPPINEISVKSIIKSITRATILENLSSAWRVKRLAMACKKYNERLLWNVARDGKTDGKLQQRYQRALFNDKMGNKTGKEVLSRVSKEKQRKWKAHYSRWKIWQDLRDIGRGHDDLGPFVVLSAFPGNMNIDRMSQVEKGRLMEAFENEIKSDRPGGIRQWLREARPLCDAIFAKNLPLSVFNIDEFEFKKDNEVTDEEWNLLMQVPPDLHLNTQEPENLGSPA